jgi:outer membrane murein-binding lipoprotein Lpp
MMLAALLLLPVFSLNALRSGKNSPVDKVIKLLTDMQTQLQADKKADEEMYDKLSCWCKVNGDGKGTAVEIATTKVSDLNSRIKALTAKSSELDGSIKAQESEVAANKEALASATSMREEAMNKFRDEEKDMILSIDSLKNALVVLEKTLGLTQASKQSFLQAKSFTTVRAHVRDAMSKRKADDILAEILAPSDRDVLQAFLQGKLKAGSAQGGEIMGVLKQMKTEFESNLADMQGDEGKSVTEFGELKEAKTSEILAGEKMIKEKTALLGKTKVQLAEAKEDLEDTTGAMEADQSFLVDLKERCSVSDKEWEQRSKTRSLEIAAVGETIKILTDDDAHDLFGSTLSFLQLSSTRRTLSKEDFAREQASHALLREGSKSGRKALVQLSASVRLDAFKKVEEEINGMIADIEKESDDEVHLKAKCKEEFHQNEMETMAIEDTIKDLTTKINDLTSSIDTLEKEIAALKAEILETTIELQRSAELRVKQNKEYQSAIADQKATQSILKKALDRLGKFYAEQFLQLKAKHRHTKQEPGAAAPPPPQGFSEYKSNEGSGSVMTMIEGIITDAKEMEQESIKGEQDAQASYESFVKESYAAIEAAQRSVTNKIEEKAQAEVSKTAAEGDKADADSTAEALAKTKADLHLSCDFVMENFEAREAARKGEIEGLQNTMAQLKTS